MNLVLESLKQTLNGLDHPILKEVGKPLDVDEIESFLLRNKLGNEKKLVSLYQFCNWIDESKLRNDDYVELSSFGLLLGFYSIISLFLLRKGDGKEWIKKLPLMTNKKGAFIVIDLNVKSKDYGKLFGCDSGELFFYKDPGCKFVTVYDSIPSFIQTIDMCYKTGAYQLEGRVLRVDKEKEREISRVLNPESDYWK